MSNNENEENIVISATEDDMPTITLDDIPRGAEDQGKRAEIAEKQANEYKDMLQRLQAEFINYRKRTDQASQVARTDGQVDAILAFLPVVDNLERAMQAEPKNETLAIIHKQMSSALAKLNVAEVEAQGKPFDPTFHNAVMQEENKEHAGKVLEVLQKGYKTKDRVIRHAMVKVAN